jgi:hypothetical protein
MEKACVFGYCIAVEMNPDGLRMCSLFYKTEYGRGVRYLPLLQKHRFYITIHGGTSRFFAWISVTDAFGITGASFF